MLLVFSSLLFADPIPPPVVGGTSTSNFKQVGQLLICSDQGCQGFCSATLIHPRWAVSAAHCIEGEERAREYMENGEKVYFVSATDVMAEINQNTLTASATSAPGRKAPSSNEKEIEGLNLVNWSRC